MPAPTTVAELIELVQKSRIVDEPRLTAYLQQIQSRGSQPTDPARLAAQLVRDGHLTNFQAQQLLAGKWRGFSIGKYKVLERLGSGGMGQVFLAEHTMMRRKVAVKVLPTAKAKDPSSLERFHREARAIAAMDHPNLVRAFDIDQDRQDSGELHYIVMEHVDGASLQEIVKRSGPLDPGRACHYVREAAEGLQYAYEVAGLIHRDIKPANIMVDRQGAVKILDMGLARFFNDEEDNLTRKYDENVLGTADYLSPEQAVDSHLVDIRADIYSLGTTFYFLLTGQPPFAEGTVAQKLIWHQTRQPTPVRLSRPAVPEGVAAILERMMMKDAAARYQTPAELAGALAPFVPAVVPPPGEQELPKLSPAVTGVSAAAPAAAAGRSPPTPTGPRPTAAAAAGVADPPRPQRTKPSTHRPGQTPRPRSNPQRGGMPPPVPTAPGHGSNPFSNLLGGSDGAANAYATAAARASSLPPPVPPPARPRLPARRRGAWIAAAAVGLLVLAGGTYAVWRLAHAPAGGPAADFAPAAHRLTVAWDARQGEFRTVAAALAAAEPGDTIVVLDAVHEEPTPVTLDARHGRGVTIEGGLGDGRPVTWRLPSGKSAGWLIEVTGCDGPRLSGFVFDGGGLVDTPLRLIGSCPGITVQNVQVQNFRHAGLRLTNCAGEPGRPVTLDRVRVTADGKTVDAAVVLTAKPGLAPKANEHVRFRDCRFEGPFTAAVVIDGPADDVTIERSRVWKAAEGVRCQDVPAGQPLRVTLAGNTFADMRDAVTATNVADDVRSRLDLRNNLFVNCGSALTVEKGQPARFVVAEANGRDRATRDGHLPSPAGEFAVDFLAADATHADFLCYRKDNPLARAGWNGSPIGVPAD